MVEKKAEHWDENSVVLLAAPLVVRSECLWETPMAAEMVA
jgi:hypothetical protein